MGIHDPPAGSLNLDESVSLLPAYDGVLSLIQGNGVQTSGSKVCMKLFRV